MAPELLARFFRNECSPDEQRKVLAWYLSGEADAELSEKIEAYWKEEKSSSHDQWGKKALFSSIEKQINSNRSTTKTNTKKGEANSKNFWRSWKYAAVFALLLLTIGWWYQSVYKLAQPPQNPLVKQTVDEEAFTIKQTARGEKLTITLDDKTVIQLNAESTIQYKKSAVREVFLEGEAFFYVARDTVHPFQIHTASVTTTVLGTSFNIKAFSDEDDIAVSVVSGKVKVEKKDTAQTQTVHLIPGEQVVYTHRDTAFAKKNFEFQSVISWKDGTLFFKNASFPEVVTTLERWYGVEIDVQRKGIENGFSGSYTNRSLESVLEGMSFVLDFEYEINHKTIIIK
ncbi:transmembrane sensor [Catalinimonas alkaloidigena]|uniref:FecR family protein n=1 Tax=Catalinimonas alkaloidigena TaxID=1075417 RepID=UPI002404E324|nr:FecR family protein [Catalinimonas alkaloidigena]MDF9798718.1 transmembrane sensor [Catalinimonas alkaloidigena]